MTAFAARPTRASPLDRFALALAAVVAAGAVLRVLYTVLLAPWPPAVGSDAWFYHLEAGLIAHGRGFISPAHALFGISRPTAAHPPLYPLVLAGLVKLGGGGHVPEQLAGTVFGAGTIAVVGLVGRRLGGERVGLIAAALAAVYPMLVSADGALMSESVYGLLIALFLLAAYRLIERPSDLRAIVFGGLLGLAALARGEAILLAPLVLVPVLRLPRGRRSALLAGLALVLVLAPWTIRNATVFHRLVPISTNFASAIAGANCPSTYYGSKIGDWDNACVKPHPGNEAQAYNRAESDGLRYAAHHLGRLPVVFAVRLARMWGFRRNMFTKLPQLEARSAIVVALGFAMYYLLVPFAVYGVVLLRRRRVAVWPLGIMFVLVSVVALMTYGEVRFREPAEIALVVFAAVGVEELLARRGAGVPLNLALASVRAP